MRTFVSGWMFVKPDQNYFKRFIASNRIALAGIVYPKKLVPAIEGIPVLDFDDASAVIQPEDRVLDILANPELRVLLETFFDTRGVRRISVAEFLDELIMNDQHDALVLPLPNVKASDIRKLKCIPLPDGFDAHFFDSETYAVASSLDQVFRNSNWEQMLAFDQDNTPANALLTVLLDMHARSLVKHLHVLDTPRVFLDAILKLRLHDAKARFTVSVNDQAFAELGGRAEFYRRSLAECIVPSDRAVLESRAFVMAGSPDTVLAEHAGRPPRPAICFMPRSIIDYVGLKNALGEGQYKIQLRQPDTSVQNLLAVVLTPALFAS